MRALWLDRKPEESSSIHRHDLRNSLSKRCVLIYSLGPKDVEKVVKEQSIDVVVVGQSIADYERWLKLDKVTVPKAMLCGDPATTMAQQVYFARKNKIDLALSTFKDWIPVFEGKMGIPVKWMPFSVNLNRILPLKESKKKDNDVLWSPELSAFYPIRLDMTEKKIFPHGSISSFKIGGRRLSYDDYLRKVIHSRMFVFDGTIWNYAVPKYYEGMACESLVVATKPKDAEALHFIPDRNFVDVNIDNYMDKIEYYLRETKERERIARRGYLTICKYHTSDIRAKELAMILNALINKGLNSGEYIY